MEKQFLTRSHKTYYDVLGVDKSATFAEIKDAYYTKSKTLHPDVKAGATTDFVELKTAYDVLRRPADRKNYDLQLAGEVPRNYYRDYREQRRREYERHRQSMWAQQNSRYNDHFRDMRARHAAQQGTWRNLILFTSAALASVVLYNFYLWYKIVKEHNELDRLVIKDEIARCFLRQAEFRDKLTDELQVNHYARILHSDIEEAMRRRDEERSLSGEHNPLEIREEARWLNAVKNPLNTKRFKSRTDSTDI